jgi:hypothetical protein
MHTPLFDLADRLFDTKNKGVTLTEWLLESRRRGVPVARISRDLEALDIPVSLWSVKRWVEVLEAEALHELHQQVRLRNYEIEAV